MQEDAAGTQIKASRQRKRNASVPRSSAHHTDEVFSEITLPSFFQNRRSVSEHRRKHERNNHKSMSDDSTATSKEAQGRTAGTGPRSNTMTARTFLLLARLFLEVDELGLDDDARSAGLGLGLLPLEHEPPHGLHHVVRVLGREVRRLVAPVT